jgi:hypothetical protein
VIVVGGVYGEVCLRPAIETIFGSGGRAAVALASAGVDVELHTYCPSNLHNTVRASLSGAGVKLAFHDSTELIVFRYLHPLASPLYYPWPIHSQPTIEVSDDVVLLFGMMEGQAIVHGRSVVFDPQSPTPVPFRRNGSTAETLAIVCNAEEIRAAADDVDEKTAAAALIARERATVIVVKDGPSGARLYGDAGLIGSVPAYQAERVYKIGSGDVFSAAFSYAWSLRDLDPIAAADYASKCTAKYCETRVAWLPDVSTPQQRTPVSFNQAGLIYLAAPFFTVSEVWLVEEIQRLLLASGANVFSPLHDVGLGAAAEVAPADLKGLEACNAILAVAAGPDPGTIFEVGYGVSRNIPVIVLAENNRTSDLTMMSGTSCEIVADLSTAIYRVTWLSWR